MVIQTDRRTEGGDTVARVIYSGDMPFPEEEFVYCRGDEYVEVNEDKWRVWKGLPSEEEMEGTPWEGD